MMQQGGLVLKGNEEKREMLVIEILSTLFGMG